LSADERDKYLSGMIRAIDRSPVLSALSFEVCALRGRFYFEEMAAVDMRATDSVAVVVG